MRINHTIKYLLFQHRFSMGVLKLIQLSLRHFDHKLKLKTLILKNFTPVRKEIPPLQKPTMPTHSPGLGGEEPFNEKDLMNTNNDKTIKSMLADQPYKRNPTRKECLPQRTWSWPSGSHCSTSHCVSTLWPPHPPERHQSCSCKLYKIWTKRVDIKN